MDAKKAESSRFGMLRAAFFSKRLRSLAFFAALAAVVKLSLLSGAEVDASFSREVQSHDHQFHVLAYAALSSLFLAAFRKRGSLRGSVAWRVAAFLAFSALGAALEGLQALPAIGRSATWSDGLSNALGAALGAVLFPDCFLLP